MSQLPTQERWRNALLIAMIPAPGGDLPGLEALDLREFWRVFDAGAPVHLRAGMRVAAATLAGALPRALGHGCGLEALDARDKDAVIQRAARIPLLRELVQVAKIVACLAYFDDDSIQDRVRQRASR